MWHIQTHGTQDAQSFPQADRERIDEVRQLVSDYGKVTPDEMSAFFYEHAYNELDLAVRDLLRMLGEDVDS